MCLGCFFHPDSAALLSDHSSDAPDASGARCRSQRQPRESKVSRDVNPEVLRRATPSTALNPAIYFSFTRPKMTSLKRSVNESALDANYGSKVFLRTSKGKCVKVVRELYLRSDIPCSSKLCIPCNHAAAPDAQGRGKTRERREIEGF